MEIKEYISKIAENKKIDDMIELGNMLAEIICSMKESHSDAYEKYKMKLYGMAYDHKFEKNMAKDIVTSMEPRGQIWTLETTKQVQEQNGLSGINPEDFYIVINSLGNDYGDIISVENTDTYVKMTDAWINDTDAKDDKVWIYFTKITK